MKSQALKEMVKAVFGDETVKTRFMTCPESVMSRFSLTTEEINAVLSTHRILGAGNSSLEAAITAKDGWGAPPALEAAIKAKDGWGAPAP